MSFLENTDLFTMDVAFEGQPFCNTNFYGALNLLTMDYAYEGQPFILPPGVSTTTSKIKQVHTTPWGNIKNFFGKAVSGIKTFGSTSTT